MGKTLLMKTKFYCHLKSHLSIDLKRYISIYSRLLSPQSQVTTDDPIRIAVVGSGPSGFYTTQQLLKNPRVFVDIYEKFPVPFGLVRYGVAPDHQSVKNVINSFTTTALNKRVSFIGNVSIGSDSDITLQEIRNDYNAVVLCYGAAKDRRLHIEGEELSHVFSARRFVGWYNGVPNDKNLKFNVDCDTAVIIGHGNVALDCARILLTDPKDMLSNTDITKYSLEKLSKSKIKNVYLVGRRGPMQVSFTIKEFRELTKLKNCKTIISPQDCQHISQSFVESLDRPKRRLTELIVNVSKESSTDFGKYDKKCFVKFLRSPKLMKKDDLNAVSGVVFGINRYESEDNWFDKNTNVVTTEELEVINCGFVLTSIGYQTILIDSSLPLDKRKGTILNENGRVVGCGSGLYTSGWAASGAQGVLLNTLNISVEVAKNILMDIEDNQIELNRRDGSKNILNKLSEKGVNVVHFDDWKRIDQIEQQMGSTLGKPREKIVDTNEIIDILHKK
ncbi:NADPH:adrenodoxin oxidoreductase, mitochondrial-like [Oppia nitens]|uniref:NADPH:adrenodoxin oxidoreductase, mitochondrial-like n=1 Tax=Oppia nitens TaxID=1686743 RepID=UPI0023DAC71B|nr:NADPH:adrenodoxin oxidoreductase, mitochondrial-like [Oppia nitens]